MIGIHFILKSVGCLPKEPEKRGCVSLIQGRKLDSSKALKKVSTGTATTPGYTAANPRERDNDSGQGEVALHGEEEDTYFALVITLWMHLASCGTWRLWWLKVFFQFRHLIQEFHCGMKLRHCTKI